MGAAIPRALNLALSVEKAYGAAITLETATSTVELTGMSCIRAAVSHGKEYKVKA